MIGLVLAVSGCRNSEAGTGPAGAYLLAPASLRDVQVPVGAIEGRWLAVRVRRASGEVAVGERVRWVVSGASLRLEDSVSVVDEGGVAATYVGIADTAAGAVTAVIGSASYRFSVRGTAGIALLSVSPASVAGGDTLRLRGAGFVRDGDPAVMVGGQPALLVGALSDTALRVIVPPCVASTVAVQVTSGGFRSPVLTVIGRDQPTTLRLARYEARTLPTTPGPSACVQLPAEGAEYLVVPNLAAESEVLSPRGFAVQAGTGSVTTLGALHDAVRLRGNAAQAQFDAQARAHERAEARTRGAAAHPGGWALRALALGERRRFAVPANFEATRVDSVTARLRFIGDRVLIYADTIASPTGFTDADYLALGRLFDTQYYDLDVRTFGVPSDVDANGRVMVLFSPTVNAIQARERCAFGFVTGFFFGSDLLASYRYANRGELLYSFVPDAEGRWSCPHTAAEVRNTVQGTFVHELQHLISFNQHVLVRGGEAERTWLNEGLSHIAEELAARQFEQRYPAPAGRTSPTQLFPDSAGPFITAQLINSYVYLTNSFAHSVTSYDGAGSLEERGASWLFLRWLADQKGEAIFGRLVQSARTGVANIESRSGESFRALFGDFAVSTFTDSLPELPRAVVPPRYRFASRNIRQLMARIAVVTGFPAPYPAPLYLLPNGGSLDGTILAGTFGHMLLRPPMGAGPQGVRLIRRGGGTLDAQDAPQLTIFRLR